MIELQLILLTFWTCSVVDQSKSELFDVMLDIFSEGKKALSKQGVFIIPTSMVHLHNHE